MIKRTPRSIRQSANSLRFTTTTAIRTERLMPRWGMGIVVLTAMTMAAMPAQADCTSDSYPDPVSYYDLNSTAGNVVSDQAGGHDGVTNGGPTITPGKVGAALRLDGVNDQVTTDRFPEITSKMSLSAWVRFRSNRTLSADYSVIDKYLESGEQRSFLLGTYANRLSARVNRTGRTQGEIRGSDNVRVDSYLNTWVHIAMTFDARTLRVYRNGALVATAADGQTAALFNSTAKVIFGKTQTTTPRFLDIDLDEVGIWDRALSAAEVTAVRGRGLSSRPLYDSSTCIPDISPTASTVELTPDTALRNNDEDTFTVQIVIKDTNGVVVPGQSATISASGTNNTIVQPPPNDPDGTLIATIRSPTSEDKTITVTVNPGPNQVVLSTQPVARFRAPMRTLSPLVIDHWQGDELNVLDVPANAPGAVLGTMVFAFDTELGWPVADLSAENTRNYQNLEGFVGGVDAVVGTLSVVGPGGLVVADPLIVFGAVADHAVSSEPITGVHHDLIAIEMGTYFLPEGTQYATNLAGGSVGTGGCSCSYQTYSCGVQGEGSIFPPAGPCDPEMSAASCVNQVLFQSHHVYGSSGSGAPTGCAGSCMTADCLPDAGTPGAVSVNHFGFDRDEPCLEGPGSVSVDRLCLQFFGVAGAGCDRRGFEGDGLYLGDGTISYNDTECWATDCAEPQSGCCGQLVDDASHAWEQTLVLAEACSAADPTCIGDPAAIASRLKPEHQFQMCIGGAGSNGNMCQKMPPGLENLVNGAGGLGPSALLASLREESYELCQDTGECAVCGGVFGGGCLSITPRIGLLVDADKKTDTSGKPASEKSENQEENSNEKKKALDPVVISTGELVFNVEDVAFPSSTGAPSLALRRNYRSGGFWHGAFGPGFVHDYEEVIQYVGSRDQRGIAPDACFRDLPTIRCLFRRTGEGGQQLYFFDDVSGVFSSDSGGFDTIVWDPTTQTLLLTAPGGNRKRFNALGRLQSIEDAYGNAVRLTWRERTPEEIRRQGVPHDESFSYRTQFVRGDSPYAHEVVEFTTGPSGYIPQRVVLGGLELDRAVDDAGRAIEFRYTTYRDDGSGHIEDLGTEPVDFPASNEVRRRRLKSVVVDGANVIDYEYKWSRITDEAFLARVVRNGLSDPSLFATDALVSRYEWQHEMLGDHFDYDLIKRFHQENPEDRDPQPSQLGEDIILTLARIDGDMKDCLENTISSLGETGNGSGIETGCDRPFLSSGLVDVNPDMMKTVFTQIADNIVLVYSGDAPADEPDVESYYDFDPRRLDFDRVVIQRYGALDAIATQPTAVTVDGVDVYTWKSNRPEASMETTQSGIPNVVSTKFDSMSAWIDLQGWRLSDWSVSSLFNPRTAGHVNIPSNAQNGQWYDDEINVPSEVLSLLPTAFEEIAQPVIKDTCPQLDSADLLPTLGLQNPVNPRNDWRDSHGLNPKPNPTLALTKHACAAIAGKWNNNIYRNDNTTYFGVEGYPTKAQYENPVVGEGLQSVGAQRLAREWDLALVCQWVRVKDRLGHVRFHGFNFNGDTLVEAHPSPTGSGFAVTLRRVNADGLVVWEQASDGAVTEVEYQAQSTAPPTEANTFAQSPGGSVLFRSLPVRITTYPNTVGITPVVAGLDDEQPIYSRTVTIEVDDVFQQPAVVQTELDIGGAAALIAGRTQRRFDYQQGTTPTSSDLTSVFPDSDVEQLWFQHRAGIPLSMIEGAGYSGANYEGRLGSEPYPDPGKRGPAVVLEYTPMVELGDGVFADVGTRIARDDRGRPYRTSRIRNAANASADTDVATLRYHASHESSLTYPAGNVSSLGGATAAGPLAIQTQHRQPTSTDAIDLHQTVYAYDGLGGVRFSRQNNDGETDVTSLRDALGREVVTLSGGRQDFKSFDDRGRLSTSASEDLTGTSPDRIVVNAWGTSDVLLGSCQSRTDLIDACAGFQGYAEAVVAAVRASVDPPAPPADTLISVSIPDHEDRTGAVWDGVSLSVVSLDADGRVLESRILGGTGPDVVVAHAYDDTGAVVLDVHGDLPDQSYRHHQYDGFGRLLQTDSEAGPTPPGENALTPRTHWRYGANDELVVEWTSGDDGNGEFAEVLSLTRVDTNSIGLGLQTHQFSGSVFSSVVAAPSTVATDDGWATTSTFYDHALRPIERNTEGRGISTASYDAFGVATINRPDETATIFNAPQARLRSVTRTLSGPSTPVELKSRTTQRFDGQGRMTREDRLDMSLTAAPPISTHQIYDGFGTVVATIDEAGRRVDIEVDSAGLVTRKDETGTMPVGGTLFRRTAYTYDERGLLIEEEAVDDRQITVFGYDGVGRMVERTVMAPSLTGDHQTTSYDFDGLGRLTSWTDSSRGGINDRIYSLSYPDHKSQASELRLSSEGNQLLKGWSRDALGRVVVATDSNLIAESDDPFSPSFLTLNDRALTSSVSRDALGRPTEDETFRGGTLLGTIFHTFDDDHRGPLETIFGSTALTPIKYGRDNEGRLVSITRGPSTTGVVNPTPAETPIGIAIDTVAGMANFASVGTTSGNVALTTERDGFGQIMSTESSYSGSNVVGRVVHAREDVLRGPTGRVVASLRTGGFADGTVGNSQIGVRYDGFKRVAAVINQPTHQSIANFRARAVEALSNEDLGATALVTGSHRTSSTFGPADTLLSTSADIDGRLGGQTFSLNDAGVPPESRMSSSGSQTIALDDHFRVSSDGALRYVHDALDRFSAAASNSALEIEVLYDGFGRRRIEKRRTTTSAIETVVLHYEGANVVGETNVSNGAVVSETTHLPGIDRPILFALGATTAASSSTYVLGTDVRGDVVSVTQRTNGTLVEEARLSTYGERTIESYHSGTQTFTKCVEGKEDAASSSTGYSSPSSPCAVFGQVARRFGIGGARAHPRTKLVDLRNRVYAPHLKGFLAKDPMGAVDSHGLWNYVAGDPVNFRDPWGLEQTGAESKGTKVAEDESGFSGFLALFGTVGKSKAKGSKSSSDTPGYRDRQSSESSAQNAMPQGDGYWSNGGDGKSVAEHVKEAVVGAATVAGIALEMTVGAVLGIGDMVVGTLASMESLRSVPGISIPGSAAMIQGVHAAASALYTNGPQGLALHYASINNDMFVRPVTTMFGHAARGDVRNTVRSAVPVMAMALPMLRARVPGSGSGTIGVVGTGPKLLGPGTRIGLKIEAQMKKRGWNVESIDRLIQSPTSMRSVRDTRHLPGGGRMNDPATAYIDRKNQYVVRNERTGDIVQISDRFNLDWVSPW